MSEQSKHPDNLAINHPGEIPNRDQSLEEKSQQVAVDAVDFTVEHREVPTYVTVETEDGEKEALHHVKDAEEISDVIREARVDENGNRVWK